MLFILLYAVLKRVRQIKCSAAYARALTWWNNWKQKTLKTMKKISFGLIILIMVSCLGCRSGRVIATGRVVTQDTTTVKAIEKLPYEHVSQLELPVGGNLHVPALGLTVTRISKDSAFVERSHALIERTQTVVQTVAAKQKTVDRSKDRSIRDSEVNTKAKKAGNTKAKTNQKQVKRGFQWWMPVLMGLCTFLYFKLKKRFSS